VIGYPNRKENNSYTYKDYLEWPEEERWEMIEGVAYNMTPSPSRSHQKISAALVNAIYQYLKGKNCEVYSEKDRVKVGIFDDFVIDLKEIFKD
jgi:Uma2 family endonuclease